MNNDLISREDLKKALEEEMKFGGNKIYEFDKGYDIGIGKAIEMVDNAPEIDLDERDIDAFETGYIKGLCENRPTGEWLHNSDRPDNLICSVCNCGWDMWRYESKELNYCPNCGAKMKGEEK